MSAGSLKAPLFKRGIGIYLGISFSMKKVKITLSLLFLLETGFNLVFCKASLIAFLENIILDLPSFILLIAFITLASASPNFCLTAWLVIILPVKLANAKTLADVFLSVRTGLPSMIPNVSRKSVFFILFFC